MGNAQFPCPMSSQDPDRSPGFSHPLTFSIRQFSLPGEICRVKLSLAVGLTQVGKDLGWGSWKSPFPLLWPTSSPLTHCLSGQKEKGRGGKKKKKKKVKWHRISTGNRELLQGRVGFVSRGSPWGKWKVTWSLFCPSIMPRCRTAVSHEDLDPTLRWCHWCQNWAGMYK